MFPRLAPAPDDDKITITRSDDVEFVGSVVRQLNMWKTSATAAPVEVVAAPVDDAEIDIDVDEPEANDGDANDASNADEGKDDASNTGDGEDDASNTGDGEDDASNTGDGEGEDDGSDSDSSSSSSASDASGDVDIVGDGAGNGSEAATAATAPVAPGCFLKPGAFIKLEANNTFRCKLVRQAVRDHFDDMVATEEAEDQEGVANHRWRRLRITYVGPGRAAVRSSGGPLEAVRIELCVR